MNEETPLEREQEILLEIIQYYLSRHEAISARTLSKVSRLELSPTTIRNLMEDLSHDGLLTSEGVSRGRIPTQKAFTVYVAKLLPRQPARPQTLPVYRLKEEEEELVGLETALGRMGDKLAELTGFIVLASLPEKDLYPLDWVRLVNIQPDKLLVAVHSLFGDLWAKVLRASDPIPETVLKELEKYICMTYHGSAMEKVRSDIMSGTHISLLEELPSLGGGFRLLRKAFEWEKTPGWHVWGRENLYKISEYQQPEQLVRLHQALENPDLLQTVLTGGRELEKGWVSIGTETGYPGLETSSVIGFKFGDGAKWVGTLAVLGPMRMDYGLILGMVSHAAATLNGHIKILKERAMVCL